MQNNHPAPQYRIGAVSKLAGIPVTTLRIWETRYQAFTPEKTNGRHRMYHHEDVLKAQLLKQLSDSGHSIRGIATLDCARLRMLARQHHSDQTRTATNNAPLALRACIVGAGLAKRLESASLNLGVLGKQLEHTERFTDLAAAQQAPAMPTLDILLIKVNTLQSQTVTDIVSLSNHWRAANTLVIYSYGSDANARTLTQAAITVKRDPLTDVELSQWIRTASLEHALEGLNLAISAPAGTQRRYSDETLARIATISTAVLCECPRHVAELITQLSSFEQYSQECLNKNTADQQLHAHLAAISGQARTLFEQALEMIAAHEGIPL